MKKILLFIALTLCFCSQNKPAVVISGTCGDNGNKVTWSLNTKGVLTISGSGAMADYNWGSAPWYSYNPLIQTAVIGKGVTSIGKNAFSDCSGLTSFTIPKGVTSIGKSAFFGCSGLTSITIPDGVTSIGDKAFYGCSGLTRSITIPNSVTSIGWDAFDRTPWYNYKQDGVVYINKVLYKYKGTMPENTSITVREGTIAISSCAFYDCYGLTSVTIPNSVTNIGEGAFSYCTRLTEIHCQNPTPPRVVNVVFYKVSVARVYVPKGAIAAYQAAEGWKEFTNILEEEGE